MTRMALQDAESKCNLPILVLFHRLAGNPNHSTNGRTHLLGRDRANAGILYPTQDRLLCFSSCHLQSQLRCNAPHAGRNSLYAHVRHVDLRHANILKLDRSAVREFYLTTRH
jgi:hypothetical protein